LARQRNGRAPRRLTVSRRPRKRFGQHFLSPGWARQVVAAIDPAPGDVFLEIGPGRGALTLPLADSGAPILAVEIDRDLVADLAAHVPSNVTLLSGDILTVDVVAFLSGLEPQQPASAPAGLRPARRFRVVGNLPYNISAPLLFRLLEFHRRLGFFADATVMLQREVAGRLLAEPGTKDYGVLTVMTTAHATISRLLELPPGAFVPAPQVRSTVVRLTFGDTDFRVSDEALFERIVRTMFQQRRKTLGNALKPLNRDAAEIVRRAGIDDRRRPETLQVTEIARLAEQFASTLRAPVL
jgi:16S rRNA (adenine1518-N6/adenine1519-N6)-dimethyltransferase